MKKFKPVLVLLIIFLIGACKSAQTSLNIININDAQGIRRYTTVYTLPKTVIRLNLKVERTIYKKGPYQQYASSVLGLDDVITEDKIQWRISDFNFETYASPDTNQIYLIETVNNENSIQLKLSCEGLLEAVNHDQNMDLKSVNAIKTYTEIENPVLIQNTPKELKDLNFYDVPLPKELYSKKTVADEASFLATKILSLRDDRAAILVNDGYSQNIPSGETLRLMLSSIDSAQVKYLSMFKGKTYKENYTYSFDYSPTVPRKKTQMILFRFSDQFGIVEKDNVNGMPMIIETESEENLKPYEQFNKTQGYLNKLASKRGKDNEKEKGLYYRIPEEAIVRLIANDKVLGEKQIQIAQFGAIHSLPIQYLDGNYKIEMYPELGSIKSIEKKENYNLGKNKK